MATSCDVVTELLFLKRDSKYDSEKPYTLQYEPDGDLPRSNCERAPVSQIKITDIRGSEKEFMKAKQGFQIVDLESSLNREDFDDEAAVVATYYAELRAMLKREFGAKHVKILEHNVRKRHDIFPIATGNNYEFEQPAAVVHIDLSVPSSQQMADRLFKEEFDKASRLETVNIWKPLRGPVTDWPLALCDARTVDMERDLVPCDVVARHGYSENLQVHYDPNYEWYYLSNMTSSEAVVFRQADTVAGVPHASFFNPHAGDSALPRESIEARAFIFY